MSASIGKVKPSLHCDTTGMQQSMDDFWTLLDGVSADALVNLVDCELTRSLCNLSVLSEDVGDLFIREPLALPAAGATELQTLQINPSDGYLVLFAAIAANGQKCVTFSHGWPVLSVVSSNSTVAKAGGDTIPAGGGLA